MATTPTLISIPFHNHSLVTFELDGEQYAVMRSITEGMGLDWSAQFRRIKRNPILSEGVVITATPTSGGPQEIMALPLRLINGWLLGIDVNSVKPEIRDTILTYQRECYDALYQYWHKGAAINPREVTPPFDGIPEHTPFDRFSANKYRELRKGGKTAVADAYLVECGITPDYVRDTLSKVATTPPTPLTELPTNAVAAPFDRLAREVPPKAEQEDGKFWYVTKAIFADICKDYDVMATAKKLAQLNLLHYQNPDMTHYFQNGAMPSKGLQSGYKISKRLADVVTQA